MSSELNGELRLLVNALQQMQDARFEALEKWAKSEVHRMNDLREADQLAVTVAFSSVQRVMTDFPEAYARKDQLEAIRDTAIRLDRESVKREPYDQAHSTLEQRVDIKLDREVFQTALTEWTTWRDQVNQRLNAQAGVSQGISRTFTVAILAIGALAAAVGLILQFN